MTDHKGAVTSNAPLGRVELDKLVADCQPEAGQALQLGCPACGEMNVTIGYGNGLLVLACKPCERQLAVIWVAGSERAMLEQALVKLDQLLARQS